MFQSQRIEHNNHRSIINFKRLKRTYESSGTILFEVRRIVFSHCKYFCLRAEVIESGSSSTSIASSLPVSSIERRVYRLVSPFTKSWIFLLEASSISGSLHNYTVPLPPKYSFVRNFCPSRRYPRQSHQMFVVPRLETSIISSSGSNNHVSVLMPQEMESDLHWSTTSSGDARST